MRLRLALALAATLAVAAPAHADPLDPLPEVPWEQLGVKPVKPNWVSDLCFDREHPRDDVVAHSVCAPVGQVRGEVTWPFDEPPPL